MNRRITLLSVTAVLLGAGPVRAQQPPLGPADGPTSPPNDLERVRVGDVAPDFTLESLDGRRVTLSSYRARRDVVLVFYRGHW